MFGWNALSVMLKEQGNYDRQCTQSISAAGAEGLAKNCAKQDSSLAVLWTIGVFALNFGPVLVGPVLDLVGPKLTSILGTMLNILSLVLLGCSNTKGFNALYPGAVILGLAGITFHLSQLHLSSMFPRRRGLVSSLLVAGFTGCGIVFYILQIIFAAHGHTRVAYRNILIVYAAICGLWIPINFWMMPWHALQIGQILLFHNWQFKVMHRKDIERQTAAARTTLQSKRSPPPGEPVDDSAVQDHGNGLLHGPDSPHAGDVQLSAYVNLHSMESDLTNGRAIDSADPRWLDDGKPEGHQARLGGTQMLGKSSPHKPGTPTRRTNSRKVGGDGSPREGAASQAQENGNGSPHDDAPESPVKPLDKPRHSSSRDIEAGGLDVVWGPLVFESRRWVELRQKSFWRQFSSAESTGMGIFYTLNVFCIQFYLGTIRLQLEHKGDDHHTFTGIANIVPAFGFLGIPVIGWLLDTKGFGITLGTINFLGVLASLFEAMPSLGFQVVTLIVWCAGRFFLYTSYYAIFGALFGVTNFGRMVAIDNTVNGLFGLLQLPLTNWGLHGLNGNFTALNLIQLAVQIPLFVFCAYMYKWEREDLIPIRPNEGEELPCSILGPRTVREARFLKSLERAVPGAAGFN